MSTVLLVGQDEMLQFTRAALLRSLGAETVCCDGLEALHKLSEQHCDLVVLCHSLPARISASLAENIHACWPCTPVLRVAMAEWEWVEGAPSIGAVSSADPAAFIQHAKRLLETSPAPHRSGSDAIRQDVV